jgi:hypothetical protein
MIRLAAPYGMVVILDPIGLAENFEGKRLARAFTYDQYRWTAPW